MDTTAPPRRKGLLPAFSQPTPDPETMPEDPTPSQPETATTARPLDAGGPAGLGDRKPPAAATRTATSSAVSKPSVETTAKLAAGLLGLVVTGAAGLIAWRTKRKLRRPTTQEIDDVALPLARIARRHADLSWLHEDLGDAIEAGAAVGAYLSAGPLLEGPATDPGVPDLTIEGETP